MAEVTDLLEQWQIGDSSAFEELWKRVYDDLKKIAVREFQRERRPDHTLQPTALVHESYLRMVKGAAAGAKNRRHFLALGALIIRRVLVDHARDRDRKKRAGSQSRVSFNDDPKLSDLLRVSENAPDVVALDDAINRLHAIDETASRVVELRYFGGLTVEETALELCISRATTTRKWEFARAWLRGALTDR